MSMTLCEGMSDGIDHHTGTGIVVIGIIAYPVATNEIGLILDGTGTSEQLPRILARLRPIGHNDDGIVLQTSSIATPARETQVVAGKQQETETFISHDAMVTTSGIILVLMSIGEKVVLVIVIGVARASVAEIMAIAIGSILHVDSQTATNGTFRGFGRLLHPLQGDVLPYFMGQSVWLGGKAGAPHLRQNIEVAAWVFTHQVLSLLDIPFGFAPVDVGL